MLPLLYTILYFSLSLTEIDAGIQVSGHLEMGDGLVNLFNGVVDQLHGNEPMIVRQSELSDPIPSDQEPSVKAQDNGNPVDSSFGIDGDVVLRLLDKPDFPDNLDRDDFEESKETYLKKILSDPNGKIVHLYGHHDISRAAESKPLNVIHT